MKLKTAQTIQAVLLALTVIVYLFGRLSDSTPLYITCLVLLGIETVIWLIWGRCPHCHALIWRQHGDYCQMCGKISMRRTSDETEDAANTLPDNPHIDPTACALLCVWRCVEM